MSFVYNKSGWFILCECFRHLSEEKWKYWKLRICAAAYCLIDVHYAVSTGGLHSNALVYFVRKTESGHSSPRQPVTELALGGLTVCGCVDIQDHVGLCVSLSATGLLQQHGIDNMRVPSRCCMWYWQMRSLWIFKQAWISEWSPDWTIHFEFIFIFFFFYLLMSAVIYIFLIIAGFIDFYPKLNNTFCLFKNNICLIFSFWISFFFMH